MEARVIDKEICSPLSALAENVLRAACEAELTVAAAESCTGGMVASYLTGVEGLSSWFRCSFVTYNDEAKAAMLDIPLSVIRGYGAVSEEVAIAMAEQARRISQAGVAVAVSGYTGAAGPHENGLVHIAACDSAGHRTHREFHFGEVSRDEGRQLAAIAALRILEEAIDTADTCRF